ncbi:hypothetical protein DH2020_005998 [Rehmannia glutinosa]|uniref:Uncharacterized protein n=1 Tax=Rehmannia glutinosa TaxID=99300 RepID=A0ABR0XHN0_REHGL
MGELTFFLGLQVKQLKDEIFISQTKYTKDLMKKFGSLLYLTASRPDITFIVGVCARFQSEPKESHMTTAKRILRYLKGWQEVGLWYPKDGGFKLIGYPDSDYAGCTDDRKSTGGHCIMLGGNLLTWSSKKQSVVSRSSVESEYRALTDTNADIIWLHSLLAELGIKTESPSLIWCDNQSATALAANPVFHARTKHVEIDVHFIREKVLAKEIDVGFVPSEDQITDLLTKVVSAPRFQYLCQQLPLGRLPQSPAPD